MWWPYRPGLALGTVLQDFLYMSSWICTVGTVCKRTVSQCTALLRTAPLSTVSCLSAYLTPVPPLTPFSVCPSLVHATLGCVPGCLPGHLHAEMAQPRPQRFHCTVFSDSEGGLKMEDEGDGFPVAASTQHAAGVCIVSCLLLLRLCVGSFVQDEPNEEPLHRREQG